MLRTTAVVVAFVATAVGAQQQCAPELCTGAGAPRCPIATGLFSSKPAAVLPALENVYFRNAAPFPAEILRVDELGQEISQCAHPPLTQGMHPTTRFRVIPLVAFYIFA